MRYIVPLIVIGLSACSPEVPNSAPTGAGFTTLDTYRTARETALTSGSSVPVPGVQAPAMAMSGESSGGMGPDPVNAVAGPVVGEPVIQSAQPMGGEPLDATGGAIAAAQMAAPAPAAGPGFNNPGISDEQSFSTVSGERSIEGDKERLAQQREAYRVIQPTAVPQRPGDSGPNIVEFALASSNPVGQKIYTNRRTISPERFNRNCAAYGSADQAQLAFLKAGGPDKDKLGVDPDGDGYACYWDPKPFRAARGG